MAVPFAAGPMVRIRFPPAESLSLSPSCIDAVVAWRIHYLTWLGRATPDLPCTVAFEKDQWKAVIVFKTRKPPPEQPPSLRQMIRSIAQLGGFLARKYDREPGTQTLWRGLQRMGDIIAAVRSFRTAYPMPP